MPRSQHAKERHILQYFQSESVEKIDLMYALVKDLVHDRRGERKPITRKATATADGAEQPAAPPVSQAPANPGFRRRRRRGRIGAPPPLPPADVEAGEPAEQ